MSTRVEGSVTGGLRLVLLKRRASLVLQYTVCLVIEIDAQSLDSVVDLVRTVEQCQDCAIGNLPDDAAVAARPANIGGECLPPAPVDTSKRVGLEFGVAEWLTLKFADDPREFIRVLVITANCVDTLEVRRCGHHDVAAIGASLHDQRPPTAAVWPAARWMIEMIGREDGSLPLSN